MRAVSASFTSTKKRSSLKPRAALSLFLILAVLASVPFGASEPQDFKILKKLMKEGAHATALEQGREYLASFPEGTHRAMVAGWVGSLLLEKGKAKEAVPLLKEALSGATQKEKSGLSLLNAEALVDLGRYRKAEAILKTLHPGSGAAGSKIVRLKIRVAELSGDPERVIKTLSLLPEGQRTPTDRLEEGTALAHLGKDSDAVKELGAVLEGTGLEPEQAKAARLALATSLYRLKKYGEAIKALEPLLKSGDIDATLLKAWTLHALKKDAQAYDLVRKACPLKGWREARALLPVREDEARADDEGVIKTAAEVARKFPGTPAAGEARLLAAAALQRRGDDASALNVLSAALKSVTGNQTRIDALLSGAHLIWKVRGDSLSAAKWIAAATSLSEDPEQKALCLYEKANLETRGGKVNEALKDLSKLVSTYKKTSVVARAYLLMGRILLLTGDYNRGRQFLRIVTDSFPDSKLYGEAALLLGESFVEKGESEKAEPALHLLSDAVLTTDQTRRLHELEGNFYLSRHEWADAAVSFSQTAVAPSSGIIHDRAAFGTAVALIGVGSPEAALDVSKSIGDDRLATGVELRSAQALIAAGQKERGLEIMEKLAHRGGPASATALWLLADIRLKAGEKVAGTADLIRLSNRSSDEQLSILAQHRMEMMLLTSKGAGAALEAIPIFRRSKPMTLGEKEALLRSARKRASTGRDAEASKLYARYLEHITRGGGAQEAASYLADRAMKRKDYTEAKRVLLEVERTPSMNLALARASLGLNDLKTARTAISDALDSSDELKPEERLEAELLAARIAQREGDTAGAMPHYEYYALKAPANRRYKNSLFGAAIWLRNRGSYEDALKALGRLNKTFRDAAVGYNYGYTLELMGRENDALKAYLQVAYASSNAQWALTARYRAAEMMVKMGRIDDARALYTKLVERTKGTVQGAYAESRLRWLKTLKKPKDKKKAGKEEPKK